MAKLKKLTAASKYVKKALTEGRLNSDAGGFKRRLAKILYNEKPELFKSMEHARDYIRCHTGNHGPRNRKTYKDKSHFERQPYIYDVPAYAYDKPKEVIIPTALKRIGIISDVHIPFQNNDAITTVFERLSKNKINCLILNGDIMLCASISRFDKDRNTPDLSYELDALYEFLDYTRNVFGDIPIYYKIGNHEERFEKLFWQKAPEIAMEYTFTEMASLNDFNIIEVGSHDVIRIADLHVYHGHVDVDRLSVNSCF